MSVEGDTSAVRPAQAVSISLPAEPRSARTARRFVADLLDGEDTEHWQLPAQLLVTELVTNAVLHARTELTVAITIDPESVRIEVRDGSPRLPSQRHYRSDATTGRGLNLVERLAMDWGIDRSGAGKTVWAVLGHVDWETLLELQPEPVAD